MNGVNPPNQALAFCNDGTIDPKLLTKSNSTGLELGDQPETTPCSSEMTESLSDFDDFQLSDEWLTDPQLNSPFDFVNTQDLMPLESSDDSTQLEGFELPNFAPDCSTSGSSSALSDTGPPISDPFLPLHGQHSAVGQLSATHFGRPLLPRPAGIMHQQQPPVIPISDKREKKGARRRKRKNPEDLMKNQRKYLRPEKCDECGKGHRDRRALERHMVSNHRKEAERQGLDVSKIHCSVCGEEFDRIRSDYLTKHMKKQHPSHAGEALF